MFELVKSIFMFLMIVALVACSTSRNDKREDVEEYRQAPPMFGKTLAPETVQVEAVLVEYHDNLAYYACVIQLEKVLAYGPATPPLAEGSELKAEIAKDLIRNKFKTIETMLESNRSFIITMRKNKGGMGVEASKKNSWSVIKIE